MAVIHGKESVVATQTDVAPRAHLGTTLAHNDVAGDDGLPERRRGSAGEETGSRNSFDHVPAELLDAEALGLRLAAVLGGTGCLLRREPDLQASWRAPAEHARHEAGQQPGADERHHKSEATQNYCKRNKAPPKEQYPQLARFY
jgi:hypothetical protein